MKEESLVIMFHVTLRTVTARSAGYKATSSRGYYEAAISLIEKIYGYTPQDLKVQHMDTGTIVQVATWTEPSKEKEVA